MKSTPNPADNSLPTKGTTDPQSADANNITNQPPPASASAAAPPAAPDAEDKSDAQSATTADSTTDPTAAGMQSIMGGDSDPSASNTSNDEPL